MTRNKPLRLVRIDHTSITVYEGREQKESFLAELGSLSKEDIEWFRMNSHSIPLDESEPSRA